MARRAKRIKDREEPEDENAEKGPQDFPADLQHQLRDDADPDDRSGYYEELDRELDDPDLDLFV